jgi:hypothetical protein
MFERDGETWMWLAESGASHYMTSVRRDFGEYRALTYRLWVQGISARAVGVGSVRVIVKADDGEEILAMLKNIIHVLDLSRRVPWSYHGLFSLTQARRRSLCGVSWSHGPPSSSCRSWWWRGGSVGARAFVGVVTGVGCFVESYRFVRHCTIAKTVV